MVCVWCVMYVVCVRFVWCVMCVLCVGGCVVNVCGMRVGIWCVCGVCMCVVCICCMCVMYVHVNDCVYCMGEFICLNCKSQMFNHSSVHT